MGKEIKYLRVFFICMTTAAIFLLAVSLIWNIQNEKKTTYELARVEALGNHNKDLVFRKWASMHGGVYVEVKDSIQPNPHLEFLKDRNVTTTNGKELTLINPAYMTRLVFQMAKDGFGEVGHITSLNPINPDNEPDEWEKHALNQFKQGQKEFSSVEDINGKEYLRFMRPMVTEKSCIKCHQEQGYKAGDLHGGISVSISMDKYQPILKAKIERLSFTHAIILMVILFFSIIAYRRLANELGIKENNRMLLAANEAKLQQQNHELRIAKEKAVESDNLKTVFLQNMSHEIRTPMNAIMGFSSLLQTECEDNPKLNKFSNIIFQRCNHLLEIINDLLDISRLESEKIPVHCENKSLKDTLSELYPLIQEEQNKLGKSDLKLILPDIISLPDINLHTDINKLQRIFINLINNALKFTLEGHIELGVIQKNEQLVEFFIADTGIGIPKSEHDKIFERFTQVEQGSERLFGGTGLGLSIAKGLIVALDGDIRLESEPGKGSVFYLTLPLQKAEPNREKNELVSRMV
jgi:signal transduction histidine kinase